MNDAQAIGAVALAGLALTSFSVPEIPLDVIIIASALMGSVQAASLRLHAGTLKGVYSFTWTVIAGVTTGLWIGGAVASMTGLADTQAAILPVYLISLAGAKIVVAVVNLDVGAWLNKFLEKRFGKSNNDL